MPGKGQDDKTFISEPKPVDSISSSGPIGTGPKDETSQSKAEEIPQAEIIVESEAHVSVADHTEVPLFKAQRDESAASSPRLRAQNQAKKAVPKSAAREIIPDSSSTSPATAVWRGSEPNSAALDHTDQVFTEIQPPLAVLAFAFLVLLFML